MFIILLILILPVFGFETIEKSICGDWEAYEDEKCFKALDKFANEKEAENICREEDKESNLITIHSIKEQQFLIDFLFKRKNILDYLWLGMTFTNNGFKWNDDSNIDFVNWASGNPQNETGNRCVQISSDTPTLGKWVNQPCGKKGLIVCQKLQKWSLLKLQKQFMDTKKYFNDQIDNTTRKLFEQENKIKDHLNTINNQMLLINSLQKNPVPIGFIYVQLSNQQDPLTLWPGVQWKDITSEYAGLFFRAEGGGSASFGTFQAENTPQRYIDSISQQFCWRCWNSMVHEKEQAIPKTDWSGFYYTGDSNDNKPLNFGLRFHTTEIGGENRPKNKAVRIWRRIN